jgi:signal transduction histidine kinase
MAATVTTHFAPAGRATRHDVRRLAEKSLHDPLITTVLEAVGGYVLILNRYRQVLAANRELLDNLGLRRMDSILGLRPGELMDCEYSTVGPDGCGTSQHCKPCGAVIAVLAAFAHDAPHSGECCMTMLRGRQRKSVEMRVKATKLLLGSEPVVALVFQDVSAEKRRAALEDVFLHDLRNTLTGLTGWAEILAEDEPSEAARMVVAIAGRMREELHGQHLLAHAEKGSLQVNKQPITVQEILDSVETLCGMLAEATDRRVEISPGEPDAAVTTDATLLIRVLVNMVKNALEATSSEDRVRLWYEHAQGHPTFLVQNPGVIPEDIALNIFRRSFSTKRQPGRGLGTYSMKLFGEQYLDGEVSFSSTPQSGTVFSIVLPPEGDQ